MRKILILLLLVPVVGWGQLTAFWPLNANANDYTGNGYNGTASSVTYSQGCAIFNGTSSKITWSDNAIFRLGAGKAGSWIFYYNYTETGKDYYPLYMANIQNGYIIEMYYGYSVYFTHRDGLWSAGAGESGTSNDGKWHQVAFTIDANSSGSSTHVLYMDGVEVGRETNAIQANYSAAITPSFGFGSNVYFKGSLKNLSLFSGTIIPPASIKNQYSLYKGFF